MAKKKDEKERTPLAKFVIGILVIAGVLIAARLILDALGWWAGGAGSLTARIGAGVLVILAVVAWWKLRRRK